MKGWKTLIFAAVLALAGVIEQFDWATVIPEGWAGIVLLVVGVVVAWLRKLTTTSIGASQ